MDNVITELREIDINYLVRLDLFQKAIQIFSTLNYRALMSRSHSA